MPSALLLSPDDQVVTAVTAVLDEMFVSYERPLDAVSAAKKLNSENFDLVLVDCENLAAAKLIFDVCRRGKDGHISIPIAIVDGHAGLPTAFRLGADLVLTKPVARDQARSTIRSAVNRVKKEQPAVYSAPGGAIGGDATHADSTQNNASPTDTTHDHGTPVDGMHDSTQHSDFKNPEAVHANTDLISNHNYDQASSTPAAKPAVEMRAMAAAASARTSSVAPPEEAGAKPVAPPVFAMSAAPAPAIMKPEMGSAVGADDIASEPAKSAPARNAAFASTPPASAPVADDDASKNEKTQKWKPAPTSRLVFAGTENQGAAKKSRDVLPMVAAVVVLCGGICAAWLTQPGFRTAVRARFERALTAAGVAKHPQMPAPAPVKSTATNPAAATVQPGSAKPSAVSPTPVTSGKGAALASSAPTAATSAAVAASPHPVSNASTTAVSSPPAPKSTPQPAPASTPVAQSAARAALPANSHKHISTSNDLDADLTIDRIQVVLPAKSAQERLIVSAPPVYPAAGHSSAADNSVILKAAIDETGKVAAAELVDGDRLLGQAAIAAVKAWRYQPYLQNGKAVPFQTIVLVDFPKH